MRPIVIGANHRSSSLGLRDALFVEDVGQPAFLERLKEAGLEQALVLSTCDRVEVLALHDAPDEAEAKITTQLAAHAQLAAESLKGQLYLHVDNEAVRHLFGVASSLDSLVIGEPQVLGQIKACHRIARTAGLVGPEMEDLLSAAYGTAKRVRTETAVAERPVSIATAAAELAREIHGRLEECEGVLLGSGDMGSLVAEVLLGASLRRLVVATPRPSQAEVLAKTLNCHHGSFEDLPALLAGADIVVTALSARRSVIGPELVHQALRKRKKKPIFLIDAGIPGDVDPAVNRLDGAFLYDLTDLERVAMEGRASREAAAHDAWAIVDDEVDRFFKDRSARVAVPAIVALRKRFEAMRDQVLAESGQDAERATRLLVSRLLHDPSQVMKELAVEASPDSSGWGEAERLLRRLFRLD